MSPATRSLVAAVALIALTAGADAVRPIPQGASPFLLQRTHLQTTITGPVAHVEVTQTWVNPNDVAVDGLYVFPLPEDAAVTDLMLRMGAREIHSVMKRKEEARADFEEARAQGRLAGLLDQERPNVFAQEIANLVPGERVEIVLSLDHPIRCEAGSCVWTFPAVVGPRFVPTSMADPGRILPPVAEEGRDTGHVLSATVDLEPGLSLSEVKSPSHPMDVERRADRSARLVLPETAAAKLDRDVRVRYTLGGRAPQAGVLAWRDPAVDPLGTATIVLEAPAGEAVGPVAPRELVFVLDCSGSMSGEPIEAAKEVVRRALRGARPGDTFQILRFSDHASGMASAPLPVSPQNVDRALAYLGTLHGEGGTVMLEGIRAALLTPADEKRLRIVAFLTDGYIGNETEILAEVRKALGQARLFSFGIGSSVNRYLLESLAEEGRGAAAFLAPKESPEDLVKRFVARIDAPVLTDVRLTWEGLRVEDLEPARMPDLFAGQQILVHARYGNPGSGMLRVEGMRDGRPYAFETVVVLPERAEDHEALGRLWARARIHRLERGSFDSPSDGLRETITKLGLTHRLMTAYTSLVAVDSVISNPSGQSARVEVPVELPSGVSRQGIFGGLRQRDFRAVAHGANSAVPACLAPSAEAAMRKAMKPESAAGAGRSDAADAWERIAWSRQDGSTVTIEADGDVWEARGGRRTLRRTLSMEERAELTRTIASVPATAWSVAGAGPSLTVMTTSVMRVAPLPATDPALATLVEALERVAMLR
jgi:Ca-activated chloride channel family protein